MEKNITSQEIFNSIQDGVFITLLHLSVVSPKLCLEDGHSLPSYHLCFTNETTDKVELNKWNVPLLLIICLEIKQICLQN